MNLTPILTELRAEQQRLDEAIISMERLAALSGVRRRGRPPTWLAASRAGVRRPVSAATRKKMATAQRKRWGKTA